MGAWCYGGGHSQKQHALIVQDFRILVLGGVLVFSMVHLSSQLIVSSLSMNCTVQNVVHIWRSVRRGALTVQQVQSNKSFYSFLQLIVEECVLLQASYQDIDVATIGYDDTRMLQELWPLRFLIQGACDDDKQSSHEDREWEAAIWSRWARVQARACPPDTPSR